MYRRDDLPVLAPLLARAIPLAFKRLRDKAGYGSLRPAAEAIEKSTGQSVSRAAISKWESGTMPQIDSALFFLLGLGFTFRDFQDELEDVLLDLQADETDPATGFVARLRASPELRRAMREIIETSSAKTPEPTTAELLGLLSQLDAEQKEREKKAKRDKGKKKGKSKKDSEPKQEDSEHHEQDQVPDVKDEDEGEGKGNGTNGPE